jgi:hypothetical protein
MSIDFTAMNEAGIDVGVPAVNFHNAGAADTVQRLGLSARSPYGDTPVGYVEIAAKDALAGLDETDPAARRLCQLRDLARRGAALGATHITWS